MESSSFNVSKKILNGNVIFSKIELTFEKFAFMKRYLNPAKIISFIHEFLVARLNEGGKLLPKQNE